MPGFFGLIGKLAHEKGLESMSIMRSTMLHEPNYSTGAYANESLGVYVGWTCHKEAFEDCMPMYTETGGICIVFSGEDHPEKSVLGGLRSRGHRFDPDNGSYLPHLYEEEGISFINNLNGWFGGVVVDAREGRTFLFNDRFGMHRVFVHEGKEAVYFASEAKALLAVLAELREFDPKGLGEFLTCGCTLGSNSLYKGVSILPGGSLWSFENGKLSDRGKYFDPELWITQEPLGEKQFTDCVVELCSPVVKRYLSGPLPAGISLTGGFDSRVILACLDLSPGQITCYTFGSMYRTTGDVLVAGQVARACRQAHEILLLSENFIHNFDKYLEKAVYVSDGCIGMSGASELYLNALARGIAPVRITGNCGDELLRGHRAFKFSIPRGGIINSGFQPHVSEARKSFENFWNTNPSSFAAFRQIPAQYHARLAVEKTQVIVRTPLMDNDIVRLVHRAPENFLKDRELRTEIISRHKPELLKIPTDRGHLGKGSRFTELIRRFEANALIRGEYWSSDGMPSWVPGLFGGAVKRVLEKKFLGRNKFAHYRLWSEKYFREYISETIDQGSRDLKEIINSKQAESVVLEHMAGLRNNLHEIDKLLTLAVTNRLLLSSKMPTNERREETALNLKAIADKTACTHSKE